MQTAPATPARSAWRYFPYALTAALGFAIVVNIGMVWSALSTFPGVAQDDVFDHSNAYDKVLAEASREAALGWSVQPVVESFAPVLALAGRDGRPLAGATLTAQARRPLGPDHRTQLAFREAAPGRYVAATALSEAGQWDLRLTIVHAGQTLHATRRIVVK